MSQTITKILEERGAQYGDFPTHAVITMSMKNMFRQCPAWRNMTPDQAEALDMIAHKMGRILNGNPNYIDSWTDIIGYARLVEERLQANEEETPAAREAEAQDEANEDFETGTE